MKYSMAAWCVIGLLIVSCCPGAFGVPALDQQSLLDNLIGLDAGDEWQQGVTAGIAGDLVWIGLTIGPASPTPYEFDLCLSDGPPWQSAPHDSETLIFGGAPGTYIWDVSAGGLSFDVGDQFTIGLRCHTSVELGYNSHASQPDYTGGEVYRNGILYGKGDLAFATWVEPRVIPAPGAIVLVGIGASLVGWRRARRIR